MKRRRYIGIVTKAEITVPDGGTRMESAAFVAIPIKPVEDAHRCPAVADRVTNLSLIEQIEVVRENVKVNIADFNHATVIAIHGEQDRGFVPSDRDIVRRSKDRCFP